MKAIATIALTLIALPAAAKDHHSRRAMHMTRVHQRDASVAQPAPRATRPCFHDPITIMRGNEEDRFSLTRCDGTATPEGVDRLSVMARPDSIPRPKHGPLPAGIRRVDIRLAERLQTVADHFTHRGQQTTLHVISGYRPNSIGSFHSTAQAIDFRIDGVSNEKLVEFCKTLPDTGCGYYPNSSFVHLDVRAPGTGHVAWIDASGPGETPHYVASWPPPAEDNKQGDETYAEKLARILPPLPIDEHPGRISDDLLNAKLDNVRLVH